MPQARPSFDPARLPERPDLPDNPRITARPAWAKGDSLLARVPEIHAIPDPLWETAFQLKCKTKGAHMRTNSTAVWPCLLLATALAKAEFATGQSAAAALDNRDPVLAMYTILPDTVQAGTPMLLEFSAYDHGSQELELRLWGRPGELEEQLLDSLHQAPGDHAFTPVLDAGIWELRVQARDAFGNSVSHTLPELVVQPVSETVARARPGQFTLEAPAPNPFNPTCRIRYHLPHAGFARLALYTSSGRRVHQADLGWQPAGDSTWDLDGNALASGLYLLDLAWAGQHRQTKLLLVK